MKVNEKRIRDAVEVIVADVLTFYGCAPLTVARDYGPIAREIFAESEGYKMLLAGVPHGEGEEAE